MEPFVASYDVTRLSTPQLFWSELDEILYADLEGPVASSSKTQYPARISKSKVPKVISGFLRLADACYGRYLEQTYNLDHAIARLFDSPAFSDHHEYAAELVVNLVRNARTIPSLLIGYEVILQYGQSEPIIFKHLQGSARDLLPRLKHQIWAGHYAAQADQSLASGLTTNHGVMQDHEAGWSGASWDKSDSDRYETEYTLPNARLNNANDSATSWRRWQLELRKKAVRLLYEVCRVQKLDHRDMRAIDAKLVDHLFDLVEDTRLHADEEFNYLLIKVIVALNEQFMVSALALATEAIRDEKPSKDTPQRSGNLIISILKERFNHSKTFGENLIFMLNRASSSDAEDLCMQLLVLKLLYLLFTMQETAHYFYTNDLKVLVDIFIRELSDLPDESESLRHTYLRVLHPLLTCTQLLSHPYKRTEIRRLLLGLISHAHLRDITPTTSRLVARCLQAEWCVELDALDPSNAAAIKQLVGRHDSSSSMTEELADAGVAIASVQSIAGGPASQVLVETTIEDGEPVIAPDASASTSTGADAMAIAVAVEDGGIHSSLVGSAGRDFEESSLFTSADVKANESGRERVSSISQHIEVTPWNGTATSTPVPSSPQTTFTPDFASGVVASGSETDAAMQSSWHAQALPSISLLSEHSAPRASSRGPGPPRPPKSRGASSQATAAERTASSTDLPVNVQGGTGIATHEDDLKPNAPEPSSDNALSAGSVDGLPDTADGLVYSFPLVRVQTSEPSTEAKQTQSEMLPFRPPSLHVQHASGEGDVDEDSTHRTPTLSDLSSRDRMHSSSNAASGSSTPQRRKPPAPPRGTNGVAYLGVGMGRPRRGSMPNSPIQSRSELAPSDYLQPSDPASQTFAPSSSDAAEARQPDSAPANSLPRSFMRERDHIPRASSFADLSARAREQPPPADMDEAAEGARSSSSNGLYPSGKVRRRPPPPPSSASNDNSPNLMAVSGSYPLAKTSETTASSHLKPKPPPINRATKGTASPRPATPLVDDKSRDDSRHDSDRNMSTGQLSGRLQQLRCAH
ncbi:Coeffector of mDia Rho GTPase, regulates actin polymerization and cell adhesion turnover [Ceraceosorus bombacis]|uniref:Coeffector of mDia Rho GTPase, regulates actin polymerization and cell adhesion turnover n=1 Tax=Ceraceosorus bombacis TaxID=401625 RepID=A0A0P1BE87_9BASI|nr:Coeffector of mDia Rho GTPase, regulates actin polymerization and cell adhesion turnover [Ceraceosorus bombacis]